MNHSGKKRRLVKTGFQNLMNGIIGMKEEAIHLDSSGLDGRRYIKEREALRIFVSLLTKHLIKIKGADIDSWRSSGFHPGSRNSKSSQLIGNSVSSLLSNSAAFKRMLTNKHLSVKEGAGG